MVLVVVHAIDIYPPITLQLTPAQVKRSDAITAYDSLAHLVNAYRKTSEVLRKIHLHR